MSLRFPVAFCPSCRQQITVDESSLYVLQGPTLSHCPLCKNEFRLDEVLQFAEEAYSWFALASHPEHRPEHPYWRGFFPVEFETAQPPDILFFLCSIVASGIIGGLAYDLARKAGVRLWRAIKRSGHPEGALLREVDHRININVRDESAIGRIVDAIQDYCERRLTTLSTLRLRSRPYAVPFLLAVFRESEVWSSRQLAERTGLSRRRVIQVLKALGATYNRSGPNAGKWTIDPDLLPEPYEVESDSLHES